MREETSSHAPRTQKEMLQTQCKGKAKVEDKESSDENPKDVD